MEALSAVLNGSVPGLWPSASWIACSRRSATSSSALTAARPAIGTSRTAARRAARHRDALGRQHQRDRLETLRLMPSLGVRATKMPPERPRPTRIRCAADSSRSASRIVGRLTPNSSASSCSVPMRSPGSSCSCSSQRADLGRDLLAGAGRRVQDLAGGPWAYRRHERRIRDHKRPNVLQYRTAVASEHTVRTATFEVLRRLGPEPRPSRSIGPDAGEARPVSVKRLLVIWADRRERGRPENVEGRRCGGLRDDYEARGVGLEPTTTRLTAEHSAD